MKYKSLTNDQVFEALSKANVLYSEYLKLNESLDIHVEDELQDDYNRDINHPLSISLYK